jgi:CheY-like chemotaxis protein
MNAMQQVQVLIADDDESLLELMAGRLDRLGFEVDRAETGRAASVLLGRKDYDLIVSDIYMPEVTGLALLKQAKEKDPHIQVVVVTASATLETAIEAMNAGAFAYLTKPFDHLSVFDNVISRAVEFRRLVLDNIRMAESQKRRGDLLEEELTERVQMTRKRQRELIDILACLPDGVVVVEEGGRVVLSSPMAEKWLARELRMGEQPIQRYLETVHDEWAEEEMEVELGEHMLRLMAVDLPVESEKERKVVVLRTIDVDESEIGEKLLGPVTDLKRGLSRLYKTTTDDQQSALLRKMATDVSQLEELQQSLSSTNGHLAPAVLPPSWGEGPGLREEQAPDEVLETELEPVPDPDVQMTGEEDQTTAPDAALARAVQHPVEDTAPPNEALEMEAEEIDSAPGEQVLAESAVEEPVSEDWQEGSVALLADEDHVEDAPSVPVDAPSESFEDSQAAPIEVREEATLDVPTVPAEVRKSLWKKVKERGWTTRLEKEAASEPSKSPSAAKDQTDQPTKGPSNLESKTIPSDARSLAEAVGKASQTPEPPVDQQEDEVEEKRIDDEEALEAFSVSLLEFEPKTRVHKRVEGSAKMSWPPPPPSKYNPDDYKELPG